MNQPKGYDRLIGFAGLGLSIWAFTRFVQLPVEVLRAHPFSSILWLAALCSLVAAAEAVEKRHAWGPRAVATMLVAGALAAVANVLEWAWAGVEDDFLPMAPPVGRWMSFILIVLVFRVLDQRRAVRGVPVPRPAPHP